MPVRPRLVVELADAANPGGIRCREAVPESLALQLPKHIPWTAVSTPGSHLLVRDYLELQATGYELM